MNAEHDLLMRMFGRPRGVHGRVGGIIMALTKRRLIFDLIELLDIQPDDQALEIGFGPGVGVRVLAERTATGHVRASIPHPKCSRRRQRETPERSNRIGRAEARFYEECS
jgi:hypothetical protein